MIDQELSEGFQKEWIENYLEKLKERIAEGDLAEKYREAGKISGLLPRTGLSGRTDDEADFQ